MLQKFKAHWHFLSLGTLRSIQGERWIIAKYENQWGYLIDRSIWFYWNSFKSRQLFLLLMMSLRKSSNSSETIFNFPDRVILGKLSGKSSAQEHMLVTRGVTIATLCVGVCDRNTLFCHLLDCSLPSSFALSFSRSLSLSLSLSVSLYLEKGLHIHILCLRHNKEGIRATDRNKNTFPWAPQ